MEMKTTADKLAEFINGIEVGNNCKIECTKRFGTYSVMIERLDHSLGDMLGGFNLGSNGEDIVVYNYIGGHGKDKICGLAEAKDLFFKICTEFNMDEYEDWLEEQYDKYQAELEEEYNRHMAEMEEE